MSSKQLNLAVYITAVLLGISLFLPLSSPPVIGDVSYNQMADIESYIVLAFCVAAVGLLLAEREKLVIIAATGVWVTFLFPAIRNRLQPQDDGFLSRAATHAGGKLQEFARDLFLHIADFSWGGYVLLAALTGFTIACLLRTFR